AQKILDQHNIYRLCHQAPPLRWDEGLAAASTTYAQSLADAGCALRHSAWGGYGENLMAQRGFPRVDATCLPAVKGWYSEVKDYDWDAARLFADNWARGTGHFTQVVWKGTSFLGCGMGMAGLTMQLGSTTYKGSCKVVVCRYRAPGNYAYDLSFLRNGERE
ncbi:hypothetical protein VOLCADRAFT_55043, partial [Volvox carteri f. nagariensis]